MDSVELVYILHSLDDSCVCSHLFYHMRVTLLLWLVVVGRLKRQYTLTRHKLAY